MKITISKSTVPFDKNVLWIQYMGGVGSMLLLLTIGMMGGWTSPYLAQLTSKNSPLHITMEEASWVASLVNMGRLIGSVPGALGLYYFGSRRTLVFTGVPLMIGWVSTIIANSVAWLYLARLANGVGLGMTFSSFPLFLGEISSPKTRGAIVTLAMTGLPLGILVGNVLGAYVSMSVFAYISMVPNVMSMILFVWIPESPHRLVTENDTEGAKKSIARYFPGSNVEAELRSVQEYINANRSVTFVEKLREFNIPENRKAGIIILLLYLFMQFSGLINVLSYLEIILTSGGLTIITPATMVIVSSAAGILSGLGTVYVADKCGRKTLLIVSSAGGTLSMFALSAHFGLLNGGFDAAKLQWLLISSVIFVQVFLFIGLSPVPSMLVSELFAPNIKEIAACFASILSGLFSFISMKVHQALLDVMGETGLFSLYGGITSIVIILTLAIIPETKGKSLQQIQDTLHKK